MTHKKLTFYIQRL